MRVLRHKKWRPISVAIMLIATMAVVFHGAVALIAHPLTNVLTARLAAPLDHADHVHQYDVAQVDHGHAKHEHGKSKAGGDCCSTVSAATLPVLIVSNIIPEPAGSIAPARAIVGQGLLPDAPAKPPRTTYQC